MSGINATWNRATTRDRALVFVGAAALVAVAGAAMFASLDGVALQLALRDPVKVWVEHLPALALGSLTVGAVAALFAASGRLGALLHWSSVASIFVLWQVGGSIILAPLFANELEPEHAGMVFPVVAGWRVPARGRRRHMAWHAHPIAPVGRRREPRIGVN